METQGLQFIVKGVTPSQSNYVDFDPYIFVCKVRRRSFDVQVRPRILSILGFLFFFFSFLSSIYPSHICQWIGWICLLAHLSITYLLVDRMDLFVHSLYLLLAFHISHTCSWMFTCFMDVYMLYGCSWMNVDYLWMILCICMVTNQEVIEIAHINSETHFGAMWVPIGCFLEPSHIVTQSPNPLLF